MIDSQTVPTRPRPVSEPRPSPPATTSRRRFGYSAPQRRTNDRIVVYGTGGIGKTSLMLDAPGPVVWFDCEDSLGKLDTSGRDIRIVEGVNSYTDLLAALADPELSAGAGSIVIDSLSRVEEWTAAHVIAHAPREKGKIIDSIEGFNWGKGPVFVYEAFLKVLAALDTHSREGRTVCGVAHAVTTNVPNPAGEDFIRWEPRLQSPTGGKASIRSAVKEWADHLLFIQYDLAVGTDGKASGGQFRTIYPVESATFLAKSRTLIHPILYEKNTRSLWDSLKGESNA